MKLISNENIEVILKTIYQTNIPVAVFDQLKKLLSGLPEEKPCSKEKNTPPKL